MSIETMSSFYFVTAVSLTNRFLYFKEGGPQLTANVDIGSYSPTDLIAAVSSALNNAGALAYTVTLNRATQKVTIAAPSPFDLNLTFGGSSIFSLLGFTGADLTGLSSYTSNLTMGSIYRPQFLLQSYIPFENWEDSVSANVNESASGVIETISFGVRNFMEFEIKFITSKEMGLDSPIETNLYGELDCRNFLKFIRLKSDLEFIPDRDTPNSFTKILLETTSESDMGVGFKMREMIDMQLAGFFSTDILKFRKVA